jgi:Nuclease-related domain
MRLRYAGTCSVCRLPLPAKTEAYWHDCVACETGPGREPSPPASALAPELDRGTPGGSARAEYERRHRKREERLEARWGPVAGVAKLLADDPQSTRAWANGAAGERLAAERLEKRLGTRATLLHDRRVPRTRGNIDHLAIASSGVWVIDTKSFTGRVERRNKGGWLRPDWRLYIGGSDRTKGLDGLEWQVAAVGRVLARPEVPVNAVLCTVEAEWPLFTKAFRQNGVWVTRASGLAPMILETGPLDEEAVRTVAMALASRLPAR